MTNPTLKRRFVSLGTVLGLSVALPLAVGVTPAYAQAQLNITKSHVGDFPRGGQGVYRITVANTGDQPTGPGGTLMSDNFPDGLTVTGGTFITNPGGVSCNVNSAASTLSCDSGPLQPGSGYTLDVTVSVSTIAPCTVTNTATVIDRGTADGDSAQDRTNIPGPDCPAADGNGGDTSILPVDLSGLISFNNTTLNNFNSPGSTINSNQTSGTNAIP
ncbi:hypothetical protein IPZ70_22415 [Streptomyces polychromogenes]|nr:hypothetical protein [Streptomyces polychromogenes]